jgi:hypothetical protein
MPTLSVHLTMPQYRKVRAAARRAKQKPSQFARRALENELRRMPPVVTMGALAGSARLAANYDPAAPVFSDDDWAR